jgi:hypothetical protein
MDMIFVCEIDVPLEELNPGNLTDDVTERVLRMKDVFLSPTEEPPSIHIKWEDIHWNLLDGRHRLVAARLMGKTHLRAKVFRSKTAAEAGIDPT